MARMSKKSQEALLAKIAKLTNTDLGEVKEKAASTGLYTDEDRHYELQSVLNFYRARIEPFIKKVKEDGKVRDESPQEFDKRFREWRFKTCDGCGEQFAYAYNYDGVSTCSLDCAEKKLRDIGIIYSRHKNLKKRWGYFHHPAIVPAIALQSLRELYENYLPFAFASFESEHPTPPPLDELLPNNHTEPEQDNLNNSSSQTQLV